MSERRHQQPQAGAPRGPIWILYVEAHPEMRALMVLFLQSAGYACAAAASHVEALSRIATGPEAFRLVITNHQPSTVDGLMLARELRAKMFRGSIMVYSLTLDDTDEAECEKHGVDAVLRNPISGALFLEKIAALCGR